PRAKVREYKRLEAKRNKVVAQHLNEIGDTFIAPSGMTVNQRQATMYANDINVIRAGGRSEYIPYAAVNRSVRGIANEAALDEFIRVSKRQTSPTFIRRTLIAQRQAEVQFLENHGSSDQAEAIKKLTLRQYDILKNHTRYQQLNAYRYL